MKFLKTFSHNSNVFIVQLLQFQLERSERNLISNISFQIAMVSCLPRRFTRKMTVRGTFCYSISRSGSDNTSPEVVEHGFILTEKDVLNVTLNSSDDPIDVRLVMVVIITG